MIGICVWIRKNQKMYDQIHPEQYEADIVFFFGTRIIIVVVCGCVSVLGSDMRRLVNDRWTFQGIHGKGGEGEHRGS